MGGFSNAAKPVAQRTNENRSAQESASTRPPDFNTEVRRLAGFADVDLPTVVRFLRTRFGTRTLEVINILRLWETLDTLFHAWRDEWTADDDAYRAKRALCFLRAAISFAEALNLVSNYKHKSWYVHLLVFVVPQQIAAHGNTWRFSTAPIESRGARLKRLGRRVVSWRKFMVPSALPGRLHMSRKTGEAARVKQVYGSSPMQQMLMKIAATEDMWHSLSTYARPDKLRLKHQLRTRHLKCEMVEEPGAVGGGGRGSGSTSMLTVVAAAAAKS